MPNLKYSDSVSLCLHFHYSKWFKKIEYFSLPILNKQILVPVSTPIFLCFKNKVNNLHSFPDDADHSKCMKGRW